MTTADLLSLIT